MKMRKMWCSVSKIAAQVQRCRFKVTRGRWTKGKDADEQRRLMNEGEQ